MMRRPIIAGNWKCNKTAKDAAELIREVRSTLDAVAFNDLDLVVCPPFTALEAARAALSGSRIVLGAQNLYWEAAGAFTGEVSGPMLAEIGCRTVIIGHSERRQLFGETDETVAKKIRAALTAGLAPILCIGETLEQRERELTYDVVKDQLTGALRGIQSSECASLVIAYEPVWAIGTGRNATPGQAQEVHEFIRKWLSARFNDPVADTTRIQYGGSVNAANAYDLLRQPDIDGALVGGASLKADAFTAIAQAALEAKTTVRQ